MRRSSTRAPLVWPRGLNRIALLGVALPVLLATCRDNPAGPHTGGRAYVAVWPVFASAVDLAAFGLVADTVRVVVVRPPADTVRALAVFFDPDSSQMRLVIDVLLRAAVETLTVNVELRGGGFALFSGTERVEVRAGRPGGAPPQQILLTYTGPGSGVGAVTIAPRDTVLTFGDSLRFRVSARDSAGAPVTLFYVRWSTSDTNVMRVNAAGLARAPRARSALFVRVRTPSGVGDSTPVTVIPVPTALMLASGTGQGAVVGRTLPQPLRVRVIAADGLGVKGIPVRFRALTGGAVADSVVVSDTGGYAQTPATLGTVAGPQTFLASALALTAVSFSATATPDAASPGSSVVTASAGSLLSGATATLTLSAKDQFGNSLTKGGSTVVFSATGGTSTGAISGTTDNGNGTYTATFTGLRAGTATTIAVTIGGTPVTSALPTIAVLPGPVARVLVAPPSATLGALGIIQQFSAVAQDANGNVVPGQTFTWTSSVPGVAIVDGTGLATAIANGAATITATTAGVSGGASITVAQVVASIVVSPANGIIGGVNGTVQFTAVAKDPRGNVVPGQAFAWSSSAPGIASIDPTGLATGLAAGSVTITASTGGVSGTATLSVAQVVSSAVISPASATLGALGLTQQFTAVAQDANGNPIPGQTFSWATSPPGVAAVDPATGLVTAIENGSATITATTSGVSGTASLSVAQVVASVAVTPASVTLDALGLTQQFSAVAKDANGNSVPGQSFSWTSSAPGVVQVDPVTGLATAVATGPATIAATAGGVSGTASLTVVQVVTTVSLSPATATLAAVGDQQQFSAVAKDAKGNVVPGQVFTWNSSAPTVVSVDQTGLARGLAIGSATITATTAGVVGTATLSVGQVIASIDVSPATAMLDALGLTQQFSAVAKDANGNVIPGQSFSWTSSAPGVVQVDPVTGLATALATGPATIAATAGGVSGTASLTVVQVVTTVSLSPATATLAAVGDQQQFSAVAKDAKGNVVPGQVFTWNSSAPAVVSVDQTGLARGLAIGSATITATTAGVVGTAILSVGQVIASIDVSPATATLDALGLTRQFTATAKDANGNVILGQSFAWASSPAGVVQVDPATGLATALANGIATITATADGKSGSAQLSVAQVVSSVTVSPATASLGALGLTQQFSAVALDGNGHPVPGRTFAWTSSDGLVATVDAGGLATALGNGAATITATTGAVSGTAALSVVQIVKSVVVTPATATLSALGFTQQFSAVAKDANGNKVPGQTFTWGSSAKGVAAVDAATGLATAVGNGLATITATTAGVPGTATLRVSQVVVRVDVSPAAATLDALGLTKQFSATARDANGTIVAGPIFNWTSSVPAVATVDAATGLATALANGVTTITATTGGVSGTATLSVLQTVTSVVVTPASATLDALGLTQQFSAVAKDANGNVVPGQSFTWTSSDGLVATVDAGGLATAVGNGAALITATVAGVSGTATLTVSQVVRSVVVSPASATLTAIGLTQQFSAVALDGNGSQVAGRTFTWGSSAPLIGIIDQNGLATALAIGVTTITATTGGVSGTANLSVL